MKGTRLPDGDPAWPPPNGSYWRDPHGKWMAMTPNGMLAGLGLHRVTEHEDGTITVCPSIATRQPGMALSFHGYLENGAWREC